MPMPTTRYGRYLYYRDRQRRRLKKAGKKATDRVFDEWVGGYEAATRRERDLTVFWRQEPRVYPLKPNNHWARVPFGIVIVQLHERGKFDYCTLPLDEWPLPPHPLHAPHELTGGYFRRLKSIPRLKHIPVLPWKHTHAELSAGDYYPFDFYPSGAPSYRSTLPP